MTFGDILKMLGYDIDGFAEDTLYVTGLRNERQESKVYADGIKLNSPVSNSDSIALLEYYYNQGDQHDDGNMKLMWNLDISMVLLHLD